MRNTKNYKVMAGQVSVLKDFIQNYKGSHVLFGIAGISGALAVALGAYGAHASVLHKPENKEFLKRFEIANRYHFWHTIVLLCLPLVKRPTLAGCLLISGQLLFCGSLYVSACTLNEAYGKTAPYGGFLLIAGWLAIAF